MKKLMLLLITIMGLHGCTSQNEINSATELCKDHDGIMVIWVTFTDSVNVTCNDKAEIYKSL